MCARPSWQKSCRVYGESHQNVSFSTCQKHFGLRNVLRKIVCSGVDECGWKRIATVAGCGAAMLLFDSMRLLDNMSCSSSWSGELEVSLASAALPRQFGAGWVVFALWSQRS